MPHLFRKRTRGEVVPEAGAARAETSATGSGARPGAGYAAQTASLRPQPVQRKGQGDGEFVHQRAQEGVQGAGGALPHGQTIQRAFGKHDISQVQAYVGGDAASATRSIGAEAYAIGDKTAFRGSPDLHTAAHEAAHVVQQRAGVSLSGGVGQEGDRYEQHANRVADAVVAGESAERLLDAYAPGASGHAPGVQRRTEAAPPAKKDGDKPTSFIGDSEHELGLTKNPDHGKPSKSGRSRSLGAGLAIKDGRLMGSVACSASVTVGYPPSPVSFVYLTAGLGGELSAGSGGKDFIVKGEVKVDVTGGAGAKSAWFTLGLQGKLELAAALTGVVDEDGGIYTTGIGGGLTGSLAAVIDITNPLYDMADKPADDKATAYAMGIKHVFPIGKASLLKFSTGGWPIYMDGKPNPKLPSAKFELGDDAKRLVDWIAGGDALDKENQKKVQDAIDSANATIEHQDMTRLGMDVHGFSEGAQAEYDALMAIARAPSSDYSVKYNSFVGRYKHLLARLNHVPQHAGGDGGYSKEAVAESLNLKRNLQDAVKPLIKALPKASAMESDARAQGKAHAQAENKERTRANTLGAKASRMQNAITSKIGADKARGDAAFLEASGAWWQGRVAERRHDFAAAATSYERAIRLFRPVGSTYGMTL